MEAAERRETRPVALTGGPIQLPVSILFSF